MSSAVQKSGRTIGMNDHDTEGGRYAANPILYTICYYVSGQLDVISQGQSVKQVHVYLVHDSYMYYMC